MDRNDFGIFRDCQLQLWETSSKKRVKHLSRIVFEIASACVKVGIKTIDTCIMSGTIMLELSPSNRSEPTENEASPPHGIVQSLICAQSLGCKV